MPIINPWFFYLMQVFNRLSNIGFALACISAFFVALLFVVSVALHEDGEDKFFDHFTIKYTKIALYILLISTIFAIFVPTKSTLISMIVAQNVTYERADMAGEKLEALIDKVINKVDEMDSKKE